MSSSFLKKVVFVIVVTVLVVIGYTITSVNKVNNTPLPNSSQLQTEVNTESLTYQCLKGQTAFDLLKSNTSDLEFSQSSFGKLVTRINNKSQGNNKYWMYYVDEKEATISADAYYCQESEQIKWELR
jgi:hypothetical protein